MEKRKGPINLQDLPLSLLSRILLFCSPQELLLHRFINRFFRRVVSSAWQINIIQLSALIKSYHQSIDAYPPKDVIACKIAFEAYLKLKAKVVHYPQIKVVASQCSVCSEYRSIVVCLGLLYGIKESEIVPENEESMMEYVSVINLLKSEFDPLNTFSKDEIKKGRKLLRTLSVNESLYGKCKEINDAYSLSCFTANAYRVSKKIAGMPMMPLVEKKHNTEVSYYNLNNIYNQHLAKYNI